MRKVLAILLVCFATQLIFSSKGAIYGDSISTLEEKVNNLRNQNQKLEMEIATLTSCTRIAAKASEDDFLRVFLLSSGPKADFSVALRR